MAMSQNAVESRLGCDVPGLLILTGDWKLHIVHCYLGAHDAHFRRTKSDRIDTYDRLVAQRCQRLNCMLW